MVATLGFNYCRLLSVYFRDNSNTLFICLAMVNSWLTFLKYKFHSRSIVHYEN